MFKVAFDRWVRRAVFGFPVSYFLISNLAPQFVIYWVIVASAHGWTYYRRSRERELRASQLEARLAETRLQLLQMQLQPHFLFNTLHAISELVHEDPETADRHSLLNVAGALQTGAIVRHLVARIHRSTIVQVDRISELQPSFHGDFSVILRDGTRLTLSRTFRDKVAQVLGRPL